MEKKIMETGKQTKKAESESESDTQNLRPSWWW